MLEAFQAWTVTLTGGVALYGLTCMVIVTIYGFIGIGSWIVKLVKK